MNGHQTVGRKKSASSTNYIDKKKFDIAIKKRKTSSISFCWEVRSLKNELAKCVDGKGFLLQAGDCARALQSFTQTTLEILLEL